jgi:dolichol kinase
VLALAVALVATVVEALSPWGIDNLTVPLASALVLVVLSPVLGK